VERAGLAFSRIAHGRKGVAVAGYVDSLIPSRPNSNPPLPLVPPLLLRPPS
jgi:hypothetical protein